MSLFTRVPKWLYNALGIQEADLPNRLGTNDVVAVVDINQGGWGDLRWTSSSQAHPASTASATYIIVSEDNDLTRLVFLSLQHSGGVASGNALVMLTEPIRNISTILSDVLIPIDRIHGHAQIFNQTFPIVVPPGIRLVTIPPATGVGETYGMYAHMGTTRAGFKVI